MGTRRKLSVSVNSCGICGGVLKVRCAVVKCNMAVNDCSMASSEHDVYNVKTPVSTSGLTNFEQTLN